MTAPDAPRAPEPVAWVIPGDDTAKMDGSIDARIDQEGEFSEPLWRVPGGIKAARERVARGIDPGAWEAPMSPGLSRRRERSLARADAILAAVFRGEG